MIKLISDGPFSYIQSPIARDIGPELAQHDEGDLDRDYLLVSSVLFNLYTSAMEAGREDLFQSLYTGMEFFARKAGWSNENIDKMRSALWRSGHAFLIENYDAVDRGKEVEELRKVLKI